MTLFEHTMLGVSLSLAAGLQRRAGWRIVALSGVAATISDWDGLALVGGAEAYARYHRLLLHNVLIASILGAMLGAAEYQFHLVERVQRWFPDVGKRKEAISLAPDPSWARLPLWMLVGAMAALSHLPADLVYSGGPGQNVWGVQLLWPFSERSWAIPLIPWGDLGATLIFIGEMFALYRWPRRAQVIALIALLVVAGYIGVRAL